MTDNPDAGVAAEKLFFVLNSQNGGIGMSLDPRESSVMPSDAILFWWLSPPGIFQRAQASALKTHARRQ
jgi:hypothetical protein